MSKSTMSYRRDPYDSLERILNKTTLTTQRVTHSNIIDVGDKLMLRSRTDTSDDKSKAVSEALRIAKEQHELEKKKALEKIMQEAERDKQKAVTLAKHQYEQLAASVAEERRRAEDQRIESLQKQWNERMNAELKAQQSNFERQRDIIMEEGLAELRKALRAEFALAKERDVATALKRARDNFKIREQQLIEFTSRECNEAARLERQTLQQMYEERLGDIQQQYENLLKDYEQEIEYRKLVEHDFKELQDDYRRFLDNTHGRFHSDYMMRLRPYGTNPSDEPVDSTDCISRTVQLARARLSLLPRRPITN